MEHLLKPLEMRNVITLGSSSPGFFLTLQPQNISNKNVVGSGHGVDGRAHATPHHHRQGLQGSSEDGLPETSQLASHKHRDWAPEVNRTLQVTSTTTQLYCSNKNCKDTELSLCSKAG